MEGIAIGTVKVNWDKDHPGMIQAEFLLGSAGKMVTDWLPVMTPFGGASYGAYFLPEVGNSVVIGFEQGSGNRPVVLGCLWDQKNPLPEGAANEKNSKLLWKTKSGYTFFVEEEEKQISFSDPEGKNTAVWSTKDKCLTLDAEETVKIRFGGKDFLTLQKGKISAAEELELTVEKTCSVKAQEDLTLEGKNIGLSPKQNTEVKGVKAEITPSQAVSIKAQQIEAEGTCASWKGKQTTVEGTTLELKAQASGKLQSSGILEVKGSILKLN